MQEPGDAYESFLCNSMTFYSGLTSSAIIYHDILVLYDCIRCIGTVHFMLNQNLLTHSCKISEIDIWKSKVIVNIITIDSHLPIVLSIRIIHQLCM